MFVLCAVLKQKKKAWKLGLCHCTDQASIEEFSLCFSGCVSFTFEENKPLFLFVSHSYPAVLPSCPLNVEEENVLRINHLKDKANE